MPRPSIIIRRRGLFVCNGIVPENQCASVGVKSFFYSVEIECETLDGRGFVCDNNEIHSVMNSWNDGRSWRASCEFFAGGGVRKIHALCPRATRIVVEVSPSDQAGIRVEWRLGMSLPDFEPMLDRGKAKGSHTVAVRRRSGRMAVRTS